MSKKTLQMSQELEKFLEEVEKDIVEGKNFAGPFSSKEEMDEYLVSL
tara:strand:+ start:736 stop:876 length:141 start_codon:yes stop_codon:yes gene_type:complete